MRGSEPECRQLASSRLVPSAPAARTTPRAVIVSPRPRAKRAATDVRDRVSLGAVRGAQRSHVGDCALRVDPHPEAFSEPQIVLHERVLGAVAAADHALPAADTARPGWTVAVEIRVGVLNAGFAEIDPHARVAVGVLDPQRAG